MQKRLKVKGSVLEPEEQLKDAIVDHNYKSCTTIPNIFKHMNYDCDIVDTPGF